MFLVIPYTDDRRDGYELRYSIRSMFKYCNELTDCVIIGDKPTWYNGYYIKANDTPGKKEKSIVEKVTSYPGNSGVLLSTDDCYALRPFNTDKPNYYSSRLYDIARDGKYGQRIANVKELFPNGLMYDIHYPVFVDMKLYKRINEKLDWQNREYLYKSVYCNMFECLHNNEQLPDCKVKYTEKINFDLPFFSSSNNNARFLGLEKLFPEPSPFECS